MFQRPFILDTSALININRSSNLHRLNRLVDNTVAQWTPGIAVEVARREDRLTHWLAQHSGTTELTAEEAQLFRELVQRYGEPFRYQGQTRKPLTSEDAEAVAVATIRGWVLVTDDFSMQIVCKLYDATYIGTATFFGQLEQFGL